MNIKKKFSKSIDTSALISVNSDKEETRKGIPEGDEKGYNPKYDIGSSNQLACPWSNNDLEKP